MAINRGDIGICSLNCLGLILDSTPKTIIYKNGERGTAYTGIHLTNKVVSAGSSWSSRNPRIVGHVNDVDEFLKNM